MTDTNPYVYELRSTYDDTLVAEFDTQEEARECLWKMYDLEAYRIVKRTRE